MSEHIKTSVENGILTIQFNRSDKKNAITMAMYQAMADTLKEAYDNNQVRVVLFAGDENCFTAGNDLQDFLTVGDFSESAPVVQFIQQLARFNKPIVAAVNGAAIGIGTTLLLHCDFLYANQDAVFMTPFVSLALCPEAASSLLLPSLVGMRKANEMLLLSEKLNAQQALELGLVNQVVDGDALSLARQTAERLAALPKNALMTTRALIKSSQSALVQEVMGQEVQEFAACLKTEEAKEAFNAFFERRKPDFSKFN